MSILGNLVSYEVLAEHGACKEGLDSFKEWFGDTTRDLNVVLTVENCCKFSSDELSWFASILFDKNQWVEFSDKYRQGRSAFFDEYNSDRTFLSKQSFQNLVAHAIIDIWRKQ